MVTIAVEQFQRDPFDVIRRVEAGETLLIVRNNSPIAELTPANLRPAGLYKGKLFAPSDLAEPLPADMLKDFEGT